MKTRFLTPIAISGFCGLLIGFVVAGWSRPVFAQETDVKKPGPMQERQELKQRLTDLQAELKELERAGKEERAAQVRRQIERIKRALIPPSPTEEKPKGPRIGRDERETVARQAEVERRHEHLRVAVENLRAAGLPELAERVAQEGKRILNEQRRIPPGQPGLPSRPGPMFEQLRNEIRELREVVGKLDRRIDELARQAAELRKRRGREPKP